MLSQSDNETLTRVGPASPMGELMRRYWIPAAFSHQIAKPDCPPIRVKLLSESLVLFRDTQGRIGLLDERCPHRTASMFYRPQRGSGAALCLPWPEVRRGRQLRRRAVRAAG